MLARLHLPQVQSIGVSVWTLLKMCHPGMQAQAQMIKGSISRGDMVAGKDGVNTCGLWRHQCRGHLDSAPVSSSMLASKRNTGAISSARTWMTSRTAASDAIGSNCRVWVWSMLTRARNHDSEAAFRSAGMTFFVECWGIVVSSLCRDFANIHPDAVCRDEI